MGAAITPDPLKAAREAVRAAEERAQTAKEALKAAEKRAIRDAVAEYNRQVDAMRPPELRGTPTTYSPGAYIVPATPETERLREADQMANLAVTAARRRLRQLEVANL